MFFYCFLNFKFHYYFTQLKVGVGDLFIDLLNFLTFFNFTFNSIVVIDFILARFFLFILHFAKLLRFKKITSYFIFYLFDYLNLSLNLLKILIIIIIFKNFLINLYDYLLKFILFGWIFHACIKNLKSNI